MVSITAVIVTRGDADLSEPVAAIRESGVVAEIVVWANDSEIGPNAGIVWTRGHRAGDTILATVEDLGVYGRYAAIQYTHGDLIYTQDDDCVVEPEAIRSLHAHATADEEGQGQRIMCNMPASRWGDYPDSCLVGWGAVFHRDLPAAAFDRFHNTDGLGWSVLTPQFAEGWALTPEGIGATQASRAMFNRTCDVVFTTLTPHRKFDLGFRHLPWAETADRMFKQPDHKKERDRMLDLARRIRDGR